MRGESGWGEEEREGGAVGEGYVWGRGGGDCPAVSGFEAIDGG